MRAWAFYDIATGALIGRTIMAPDRAMVDANTPEGCAAIEGRYDPASQRVDLEVGDVVDWQPPSPGQDHAWDSESKRYVLTAKARERRAALAAIAKIERQSGPRAVREALLSLLPDGAEKSRLQELDDAIAAERQKTQ